MPTARAVSPYQVIAGGGQLARLDRRWCRGEERPLLDEGAIPPGMPFGMKYSPNRRDAILFPNSLSKCRVPSSFCPTSV